MIGTNGILYKNINEPEKYPIANVPFLKNENLIPISKESKSIVVAGRGADNLGMQCGGWTINWQGGQGDITIGTTILDGIKESV